MAKHTYILRMTKADHLRLGYDRPRCDEVCDAAGIRLDQGMDVRSFGPKGRRLRDMVQVREEK
jgi:hypothetical protein